MNLCYPSGTYRQYTICGSGFTPGCVIWELNNGIDIIHTIQTNVNSSGCYTFALNSSGFNPVFNTYNYKTVTCSGKNLIDYGTLNVVPSGC